MVLCEQLQPTPHLSQGGSLSFDLARRYQGTASAILKKSDSIPMEYQNHLDATIDILFCLNKLDSNLGEIHTFCVFLNKLVYHGLWPAYREESSYNRHNLVPALKEMREMIDSGDFFKNFSYLPEPVKTKILEKHRLLKI